MMVKMIKYKKGDSNIFMLIAGAILALILVFLLGPYIKEVLSTSKTTVSSQFASFEDCDKDGFVNKDDQCPCIYEDREEEFKGCPKGTTEERSKKDIKDCFKKYVDPSAPSNMLDKCEKGKSECLVRCDYVHKYVAPKSAISAASIKGKKGNWDLKIKEMKITDESVPRSSYTGPNPSFQGEEWYNLANPVVSGALQEALYLKVSFTFENGGPQKSENSFWAIQVCDSSGLNCQSKSSGSISPVEGFDEGKIETKQFAVGNDGDACDGDGTQQCTIKLILDVNEQLNEGLRGEANNEQSQKILITGQKWKMSSKFDVSAKSGAQSSKGSNVYWTIELVINDEGSADPKNNEINQACEGYIGDKGHRGVMCTSWDNDCGEGEFPFGGGDSDRFPSEKGCLVVVSEDDGTTSDCGFAGVETGFFLDVDNYRKIEPLKTEFKKSAGDDADNAMSYFWKSKPSIGSLLCLDGYWLACDANVINQLAITESGSRWRCEEDSRWVPR